MIYTAGRRSNLAEAVGPGEEGAEEVESGELGGVARLREWPCMTSKGEADIP